MMLQHAVFFTVPVLVPLNSPDSSVLASPAGAAAAAAAAGTGDYIYRGRGYGLVFTGGNGSGSVGKRYACDDACLLATSTFNSSVTPATAVQRCEALCSANVCCVGFTLLGGPAGGTHRCYTVNVTTTVGTTLVGNSYQRLGGTPGCTRPALAKPAPVRFPIRAWSISCDLYDGNRSLLYSGVNLLTEGAPYSTLAPLYHNHVAVLARRDVERPFDQTGPCRTGPHTACIDVLAEQFSTNDSMALWSGVGLDEWTLANWTGVPGSGVPWPHPHFGGAVRDASALLQAGYREGRRRHPGTFAAAWVAEGADDAFAELMQDGTFDMAMLEGYSVCWKPNGSIPTHCGTIEQSFPMLRWARQQGFINRTVFAFGWMVPTDATGPLKPPLANRSHPPKGWTVPRLEASMRRLKAAFPELAGVAMWGGDRAGCGNASLAFIRAASELMAELWPDKGYDDSR
eukprot:COSAG01_NODE_8199_length_2878_cov_19.747391_1_plen_456_part_00